MIDFVVFLDLYFDLFDCGISCLIVVGCFVVLILGFDLVVMMACGWFVIVLFWITSGLFCFGFGWFVNSVVWFFLVCFICVLLCVRCVLVSVRCLSFCVGFDCCRVWCVCVYCVLWCLGMIVVGFVVFVHGYCGMLRDLFVLDCCLLLVFSIVWFWFYVVWFVGFGQGCRLFMLPVCCFVWVLLFSWLNLLVYALCFFVCLLVSCGFVV